MNIALHTLEKQNLMDRLILNTEPKIIISKKIDENDPLISFIPDKYRNHEVLPHEIAIKVYEDALLA